MADTPLPSTLTWLILIIKVLSAIVWRFTTTPIRWFNWKGANTVFEDVCFVATRSLMRHCDLAVLRVIFKPTTQMYEQMCKQTGREPRNLVVEGVKSHWIGDENADVVVLYLHGGGYTQPSSPDHFTYLDKLEKYLNSCENSTTSASFLVPAYSLAPEQAIFPTQLREAAATLLHLIAVCSRDPSSIILAGDSAGGGLVMALLSHILHPRDDVVPISLQKPLRGVLLYSPWVSFSTKFDSYKHNEESDTISAVILQKWASMYLGEMDASNERTVTGEVKSNDSYAEAFLAEPSWWSGLPKVVSSMLVWVGGQEILREPILEFVSGVKEGWKTNGRPDEDITLVEERYGAHIGPILDMTLGTKGKRSSQVAVEAWLLARVSNKGGSPAV